MLFINPQDPRVLPEPSDLNPVYLGNPEAQPERDRLRHLIIGSPEGVRSAIHQLHVLNYAEQLAWSQKILQGLGITSCSFKVDPTQQATAP